MEENKGFDEALYSQKEKKFKTFFNLGFNNRWKKLLPKEMIKKIEDSFEGEMKDISSLEIIIRFIHRIKEFCVIFSCL